MIVNGKLVCDATVTVGLAGVDGLRGDEHQEYCPNAPTNIIVQLGNHWDDEEYSEAVSFICDEHAPEMMHEIRSMMYVDDAPIWTADLNNLTKR